MENGDFDTQCTCNITVAVEVQDFLSIHGQQATEQTFLHPSSEDDGVIFNVEGTLPFFAISFILKTVVRCWGWIRC